MALIFENLLKGSGNVLGSICFKTCKCKRGLYQLLLAGPAHLFALPFVVVSALVKVVTKTYFIARHPNGHIGLMWLNHDPKAKADFLKLMADAKRAKQDESVKAQRVQQEKTQKAEKSNFDRLNQLFNDSDSQLTTDQILELARCHANGKGTPKCQDEAVRIYEEAAKSGHVPSMYFMACCYEIGISREKDLQKSLYYLDRGVKGDYARAKVRYALYLITDLQKGKKEDLEKAHELLREGAAQGNKASRCLLYGFLMIYSEFQQTSTETKNLTDELLHEKLFKNASELMMFIMAARGEQAKYEFKKTAAPGLAGLDEAILGKTKHDPTAWSKIPILKIKFP